MSVTILVTFDELPEADQAARYTEQQSAALLELEEKYRTDLVERLPADQREQHGPNSRHFWYNGEFQRHRDRFLYSIASTAVLALNFRRDTYLVSTPRQSEMDLCIDPELTVTELVEHLHKTNRIGAVCCYDVLSAKGAVLNPTKSLVELNVLPYTDSKRKQDSHLRLQIKRPILRNAIILMVLSAVVGLALGWFIHHRMVQ